MHIFTETFSLYKHKSYKCHLKKGNVYSIKNPCVYIYIYIYIYIVSSLLVEDIFGVYLIVSSLISRVVSFSVLFFP